MNQVMTLADDKNINIYYTDTDSIHISEDGVESLAKFYELRYVKKLSGKQLGQFHCDFDPPEWKDGITKKPLMNNVESIGLITLGKSLTVISWRGLILMATNNTHITFE